MRLAVVSIAILALLLSLFVVGCGSTTGEGAGVGGSLIGGDAGDPPLPGTGDAAPPGQGGSNDPGTDPPAPPGGGGGDTDPDGPPAPPIL